MNSFASGRRRRSWAGLSLAKRANGVPRFAFFASVETGPNPDFWRKKFAENVDRDKLNLRELAELGYRVLVVWECETKDAEALEAKLRVFLFDDAVTDNLTAPGLFREETK